MRVLIKNAKIISPSSPINGQSKNILIENGTIKSFDDNRADDLCDRIIDFKGLHVSTGWYDCFANFCDPGNEQNETIATGAKAAAAGGFTGVMLMPNTSPVVYSKTQIEYLKQQSRSLIINIFPIGAVTKNVDGAELSEMYDMYRSGAVAFSDGLRPVQSSGVMLKALQYILPFNGVILQVPEDKNISATGLMNEGLNSTQLGLPGKPAIAEELLISRDIELAKYTNSAIHITGISTQRSVELIAAAKKEGVKISCSVTPYHLSFCDDNLAGYDTNLKVDPPLRTNQDMHALRDAVNNNVIDCIASHHLPYNWDYKACEFEYAKPGMSGLESMFGAAIASGVSVEHFVKMQTSQLSEIFNLPIGKIEIGEKANLTLFDPNIEYTFSEKNIYSKSKNNAFIGKTLKGKPLGIINGEALFLN